MRNPFALMSLSIWLACAPGCGASGPKKYPVSGSVMVNGRPAALVRVQFRHADASLPGNLKTPVGMTDESGAFQLSTGGDRDGAVEGEYAVTFEWLSGNDLGAWDKFGGKFARPDTGTRKVLVEAKSNALAPFELTIPDAQIMTKPSRPQ